MGRLGDFRSKIDPDLVIQEAMYGFIMALTFTTVAQVGLATFDSRAKIITAILAMDFVWGVIDMYIFYRMDVNAQRRQIRLMQRLYSTEDKASMRDEIRSELEGTLFDLADDETEEKAIDVLEAGNLESGLQMISDRRRYLFNAVTAFASSFGAAFPAVLCLMFIHDDTTAYFASSLISSVALFFISYLMSSARSPVVRAVYGLTTTASMLALTFFAAYLGGRIASGPCRSCPRASRGSSPPSCGSRPRCPCRRARSTSSP